MTDETQEQPAEEVTPTEDATEELKLTDEDGGENLVDKLQGEIDDLNERILRVSADYQNFVRRSEQNLKSAKELQVMDVARELVTVLDNFDHALEVDVEKTSAEDVLKGVTMVRDGLFAALGKFGLERVDVEQGDEFDPNKHEALMRQPAEGIDSNHITMQLQPGYLLKEKVVRPAKVAVAE